ncbi:hypothetical protein V3J48_001579 [Salmonella enterica]|nr:hypothetical protein [Salmonella enterica]
MQKRNRFILLVMVITALLVVSTGGYLYLTQGIYTGRVINQGLKDKKGVQKIAVYTQDSAFKNEVINKVISFVQEDPVYLEIMPVENIKNDLSQWDKVVVFSTIQYGEPDDNIRTFINNNKHNKKLGVFLTANSGEWIKKPHDIDAFTSASAIINNGEYIDEFSERIMMFIAQ